MGYDRFMISPLSGGLENNVKPFLIADDAYAQLNNAYLWRGRVRKRFGSQLMNTAVPSAQQPLFSRLRLQIGTTGIAAPPGTIVSTVLGNIFAVGQMFSVGNDLFTVFQGGGYLPMKASGSGVGNYDTTNGNFDITGVANLTPVYWYPAQPVMGLPSWESPLLAFEPVFGFDTQFAYQYIAGAWTQLGTAVWTGSNSQLFWSASYRGVNANESLFYVTNYNPPDQIKYWDGAVWTTTSPIINLAGDTIRTTRIIVGFQDRLLFLNNIVRITGVDRNFTNQVRWSQDGDPTAVDAFREDIPGKGGFLNAPTKEDIITAQILRNRLIVFFKTSTWELVYNSNQVQPFTWQSLNIELGADSTFSHIPFNEFILGIGNQGVQACNGIGVERIDQKIPDEVIKIHNQNEGSQRVYGIRDYHLEMVYWTFPSSVNNPVFPDRVFVYNYKTQTWAFNNDSITCFGYFQDQPDDTWANDTQTWEDDDSIWSSGFEQSNVVDILAGNQEGFVFIIKGELNSNAPSLQITNIIATTATQATITAINHNLQSGEYVRVLNALGITSLNNKIYKVTVIGTNTFTVLEPTGVVGTYLGQGTLSRVSNIDILTKQYNFYMKEGRNAFIAKVDFLVDKTEFGQITVDSFVSSAGGVSLINSGTTTGALVGTGILETSAYTLVPLEEFQDRVWHAMYLQADGECVQLRLYWTDAQIRDVNIVTSDFQLNAMLFWSLKTSSGFTSG